MAWPCNELKNLCFNGHMAGPPIKPRNLRNLLDAVLRSEGLFHADDLIGDLKQALG